MPNGQQGQVTPRTFATSVLRGLGAPTTGANINSLIGWQAREGGNWHNTASYNPLNTTLGMPGARAINSAGVKAYGSWQQGLQATINTLRGGGYQDIINALRSGNGLTGNLQGLSRWSGGGYSSIGGAPVNYNPSSPGTLGGAQQPRPVTQGPQNQIASRIRTGIIDQALGPSLAGLEQHIGGGLLASGQDTLLHAHGDLQELAGPTTLNTLPQAGEGGSRVSAMVHEANSLIGKPYVWGGGHGGFGPQSGYDCSGFVSAVLHAGGFLSAPQTTQTLAGQPKIANGAGRYVTIYDRTDAGGNDHVIINLNGAWYEAGGQSGPWGGGGGVQRIEKPSASYLGSFNRQLHPLGL